jgi:hypothetical protein
MSSGIDFERAKSLRPANISRVGLSRSAYSEFRQAGE